MKLANWISLAILTCYLSAAAIAQDNSQHVILVVGAAGDAAYGEQFAEWAGHWQKASANAGLTLIGGSPRNQSVPEAAESTDKEKLLEAIKSTYETSAANEASELWIVLIGHGTFDGNKAKFNLRGPDVSAKELNQWLKPRQSSTVVINCASSSSPFIGELSGPNRVVVTSTQSGYQYNFARFGKFLSQAIDRQENDLDKDGQTSLLEAFCAASAQVEEFYRRDNRLATEQALIDDNGDRKGTPANWFNGIQVIKQAKTGTPDGLRANQAILVRRGVEANLSEEQRRKRNQLEKELQQLRRRKNSLDDSQYLKLIEPILVKIARLYESPSD